MPSHTPFVASILGSNNACGSRVAFHVDGQSLIELVRDVERPFASLDGAASLAGNYEWPLLSPRLLRVLCGDRAAGRPVAGTLLNCACGLADCWPLSVTVRVQSRIVVWEDFRQLRREDRWNYRAMPAIRFATASYLDEIAKLRAAHATLKGLRGGARETSSCAL